MRVSSLCKYFVCLIMLVAVSVRAEEEVKHRFIAVCFAKGEIHIFDKDGKKEWSHKPGPNPQDAWMLPNGNILVSNIRGAKEITVPEGKVVWKYKSKAKQVENHTVQPLPNGNVLVLEGGPRKLMEIDKEGKIAKEFVLETSVGNKHMQFRSARKTKKGTYIVAFLGEAKVKEFDSNGKLIKEIVAAPGNKSAHSCVRLPNGNTLVTTAGQGEVKEFDKKGEVVWHLTKADMMKAGVKKTAYTAGVQRLPNGNTVVAVYSGNPKYFEVTPEKKMVWQFNDPSLGKISNVTILDGNPNALKGEVLK